MPDEVKFDEAREELGKLQCEFLVTDEWGIFPEETRRELHQVLTNAATAIEAKEFVKAEAELMAASLLLTKCESATFTNIRQAWYALNARIGLIGFLVSSSLSLLAYHLVFAIVHPVDFSESIQQPAFWGLLGAYTKSLYWLQQKIGAGTLRPRFHSYFLVAPAVGLSLGGALWLVCIVAYKLFSDDTVSAGPDWTVIGLLAFFGGFNWEWALEAIKSTANRVRSTLDAGS